MSTTIAPPLVHRWVDRLTPAQLNDLGAVVNGDRRFPPLVEDDLAAVNDDPVLALIGSIDDPAIPADYAENSDYYARQAAWQRHLRSA